MEQFEASQQLVEILLNSGFIEDTQKTYPTHAIRFKSGEYNPHYMKRHFMFPGTREKVYFDYIHMRLPGKQDRYKLSLDETKSMITFCSLSAADRKKWEEQGYNSLSAAEIINKLETIPEIYSSPLFRRIAMKFRSLTIQ
jgi:hypothetical protein